MKNMFFPIEIKDCFCPYRATIHYNLYTQGVAQG